MSRILSLTTAQQVLLSVDTLTMAGLPARLEGTPVYTVQSGDCTIVPVDERSAMLVAGDKIGRSEILVEAHMDVGDGLHLVQELLEVQVHGEHAAHLGLTIGEPELNPKAVEKARVAQEAEQQVSHERSARRRGAVVA